MKMFMKIQEYIEDAQTLVCVLIGEVRCFSHAQQSALTDTVPSNSVSVVNSLPAQMDQIRRYSNCHVQRSFIVTIAHVLCKESAVSIKQNQYNCLLSYHGNKVWMVSINMKVELHFAQMTKVYINIYGHELTTRQKFHTHVHSRDTMN